jgi:membrane-associated protein
MLDVIDTIFDWLKDYSASPWFYLIILIVAFFDSFFPVVPSETMVIIGGVSAGLGQLEWPLVALLAALGAFLGDNFAYYIGVFFSERLQRRYNKSNKGRQRLRWAQHQIENRGGNLLITARFIPGGRTIVTLSCGITGQSRRWFGACTPHFLDSLVAKVFKTTTPKHFSQLFPLPLLPQC